MKSILQNEKVCILTGSTHNLDIHHCLFGSNRKMADKYGLWVYLSHEHHIADSPFKTPHNDRETDLYYKRMAQRKFEALYGHDEWMKIFGRNYL